MQGVGYITLYGLNTLPTIYGTDKKGIKESDFDAVDAGLKDEYTIEIGSLNDGIELAETREAVGGWLKDSNYTRTKYDIATRPFLHDDSDNDTFTVAYTNLKSLQRYKYKFIKVYDYLYSVNSSITGDILLFPIAIESIEIETQPNEKVFTIAVKHSQINNL